MSGSSSPSRSRVRPGRSKAAAQVVGSSVASTGEQRGSPGPGPRQLLAAERDVAAPHRVAVVGARAGRRGRGGRRGSAGGPAADRARSSTERPPSRCAWTSSVTRSILASAGTRSDRSLDPAGRPGHGPRTSSSSVSDGTASSTLTQASVGVLLVADPARQPQPAPDRRTRPGARGRQDQGHRQPVAPPVRHVVGLEPGVDAAPGAGDVLHVARSLAHEQPGGASQREERLGQRAPAAPPRAVRRAACAPPGRPLRRGDLDDPHVDRVLGRRGAHQVTDHQPAPRPGRRWCPAGRVGRASIASRRRRRRPARPRPPAAPGEAATSRAGARPRRRRPRDSTPGNGASALLIVVPAARTTQARLPPLTKKSRTAAPSWLVTGRRRASSQPRSTSPPKTRRNSSTLSTATGVCTGPPARTRRTRDVHPRQHARRGRGHVLERAPRPADARR